MSNWKIRHQPRQYNNRCRCPAPEESEHPLNFGKLSSTSRLICSNHLFCPRGLISGLPVGLSVAVAAVVVVVVAVNQASPAHYGYWSPTGSARRLTLALPLAAHWAPSDAAGKGAPEEPIQLHVGCVVVAATQSLFLSNTDTNRGGLYQYEKPIP